MKRKIYTFTSACILLCATHAYSQTINTIAGTGSASYAGDGGAATAAQINNPNGTAADATGNIYIADAANSRVRMINPSGVISTVAGTGSPGTSGDGGPATAALLNYPVAVAVDAAGSLYIADYNGHNIRKVTSGTITSIAGMAGMSGSTGDGGPATAAHLNGPMAIAIDASGTIYIADNVNNKVRKIAGGTISTFAGSGAGAYSGDAGPATAAGINGPSGLAVNSTGTVYISDSGSNRVRYVENSSGKIYTAIGNGVAGYSGDGGAGGIAKLNHPLGIAFDASDNLYITDNKNNCIRRVSSSTGIISTYAGTTTYGFSGDGGPAAAAMLSAPKGVSLDATGNLYIADAPNHRIRKVTAATSMTITGGTSSICIAATTTLSNATPGGTWSSSATATATVGTSSGIVTGIAAGTATITYHTSTDAAYKTVTVISCSSHAGVNNTSASDNEISIFPNPAHGVFTILVNSDVSNEATVTMTDLVGSRIKTIKIETNRPNETKPDLPAGMYFLNISSGGKTWSKKIVLVN